MFNHRSKKITVVDSKRINSFINKFRDINPSYDQLFKRKDQRQSMERLLNKLGEDRLNEIIRLLEIVNITPFAPNITTPKQLEEKLGNLIAWFKKEENRKSGNNVIVL